MFNKNKIYVFIRLFLEMSRYGYNFNNFNNFNNDNQSNYEPPQKLPVDNGIFMHVHVKSNKFFLAITLQ